MSSRDDIDKLYSKSKKMGKAETFFFGLNVVCTVLSMIAENNLYTVCIVIQIAVAIAYFVCNIIDNGILWYEAEKARRKNNIQVAFDTRLSESNTEGYYNNDLQPSMEKYALNTFESNYFSKEISSMMLKTSLLKTLVAIIIFILSCIFLEEIKYILIIAQTIFSAYICMDFVMLILYVENMKKLYDEAYVMLITQGIRTEQQKVMLINYIMEYEAIKAHFRVRLDGKIHTKEDERLSREWKEIVSHYHYNEG